MKKLVSCIPDAPKELTGAIKHLNFFIPLLLFGLSAILIFLKRKMFAGSPEALVFYGFLVFTWFCGIVITLAGPWPSHLQAWLLPGFSAECILIFLPVVFLLWSNTDQYPKKCREASHGCRH